MNKIKKILLSASPLAISFSTVAVAASCKKESVVLNTKPAPKPMQNENDANKNNPKTDTDKTDESQPDIQREIAKKLAEQNKPVDKQLQIAMELAERQKIKEQNAARTEALKQKIQELENKNKMEEEQRKEQERKEQEAIEAQKKEEEELRKKVLMRKNMRSQPTTTQSS
ncbi:lipoprotein [Mycoplasmopsis californica]|uniref:Lipoprotein n=1 Tax=Mycoplasmopsis californica TaxID=2113 RepID=A0A059XRG9_9BACT|nr:hypothetical protein [Mycoplasmopsis californica]AIA29383.1 lipoprotein [Mycoplasmopsis californica]